MIDVASEVDPGLTTSRDLADRSRCRNVIGGRRIVNVIVPDTTADLERITRASRVALLGVEFWSVGGHGIVAEALIAVHDTGDGVASELAA